MYITCVILCLFSSLSRRVGALQISIYYCYYIRADDQALAAANCWKSLDLRYHFSESDLIYLSKLVIGFQRPVNRTGSPRDETLTPLQKTKVTTSKRKRKKKRRKKKSSIRFEHKPVVLNATKSKTTRKKKQKKKEEKKGAIFHPTACNCQKSVSFLIQETPKQCTPCKFK